MENKPVKISNNPPQLGTYKHYKGDMMEVIGTALHSETLEEFVVYKHISGKWADEKNYWVRPLAMFTENVLVDGQEVPRFKFIENKI
jgi:hypothetical protein